MRRPAWTVARSWPIRPSWRLVPLEQEYTGAAGQVNAMNRQLFAQAAQAPTPSGASGVAMYGYSPADTKAYEAGEKFQTLPSVRQVGNQAVYRRSGNVWVAANAATVDLDKLAEKAKTIDRFSEEYFEMVRSNTVAENQVLASQQPGEELVIQLRGQVYRIR